MLRHDALTRYLKQNALSIPFSLRDMGGKRCDDIWSRASNPTRRYGAPLNFAFVCFLVLPGASELVTDTNKGGELGKAQSMFCAEIPLFASIYQNSCYHFFLPTPPRRLHCLHCHPTHTILLSVCTYAIKAQNKTKPNTKRITPNAPPASRIMQPY